MYSVISPEGCAAILWRDAEQAPKAAAAFKPDAAHCLELGVIDGDRARAGRRCADGPDARCAACSARRSVSASTSSTGSRRTTSDAHAGRSSARWACSRSDSGVLSTLSTGLSPA